jgi:Tol biopolymer transport system component
MGLAPGTRLGPYEIGAPLGMGGMGEVYRARDAKLNRDVALKILPDAFATDAARLARFRQEAQVLASLSHPNIGQIYGFEDSGVRHALVLELVAGPTLADRIALGPLTLADALSVGKQIASALAAAHDQGVVHRDLKPANIKVRDDGVVKVLDFGLAQAVGDAGSPTITAQHTQPGAVMGTPAYMSPEQARGAPVDKRSDIWAFGCVLYEALTGRAAFSRATVSDTLVAVLSAEPAWDALPETTPARVRALLHGCLEKDAMRRVPEMGAVRDRLEQPEPRGRYASLGGAALAVLGLLVVAFTMRPASAPPGPVTSPAEYTQITNFTDSATAPSLSPDGRMVTFIRGGEAFLSFGQVWLKLLPNGESVALTSGPNQKYGPVFTPDGSRIAYTELTMSEDSYDTWTVPALGGPPTLFLPNASGLTWIGAQRVLFAEVKTGLHMGIVTATETRSEARAIYFPEHERGMAHFAALSPDHRSLLVVEMGPTHTFDQPCRLMPFDGSSAGQPVGPRGYCTAAAWSPDGQWMYFAATVGQGSHLWRQRFDDGTPEQITFGTSEEEGLAIAPDGRSLITSIGTRRSAIWIHEPSGDRVLSSEGFAGAPRLSRDGTRVLYLFLRDLSASSTELRSLHLPSGKVENLLPGISVTDFDVSPDDTHVAYSVADGNGGSSVWLASLDRRAAPRQVAQGADQVSFGAEGELIFRSLETTTTVLGRIKTDGSGRERLTNAAVLDKFGVSPDGRWAIVYSPGTATDEPGTIAVPLRGGQARRICDACLAGWSLDGRFFYAAIERSARWSPRASWTLSGSTAGKTLAIPVPAGQSLPDLPAAGILSAAAGAALTGASVIDHGAISPGPTPSTYVYARTELQRNLYRIPLH